MDPIQLLFSLIAIAGVLIYIFLVFNFNYWRKRGIDGPRPRALFGNLPNSIFQSRSLTYDLDDIYRAYKSTERFVGIFSIRTPQLLILDPKLIQEILITNFKKFHDNELGLWIDKDCSPIFAGNPFMLNGAEWKEKRSQITPALSTNRIKAIYPIMQDVCSKMTKYLEKEILKSHKDGINAKELGIYYTIEVVGNCIYGVEAGAFSEPPCKILEMGERLMEFSGGTFTYVHFLAIIPMLAKLYKKRFVQKEIADFFINLLHEAIELHKKNKINRADFLSYLLELKEKKNLSSNEMASHTMTFFMDGFETSGVVIANCLHLLAANQHAQKTLREEINAALAEENEISFEKLHSLSYLDQCINETVRIRPPAFRNHKICTESCEIKTNKDKPVKIDKGTVVVLPYYSIHHDEEFYPNPEQFDPDRFSLKNGGIKKYRDSGVFLAFGDGPRICLGMRFGVCQTKVAIVEIIRNWEISVNSKTQRDFVIDRRALLCIQEGGSWLDFKRINKK